MFFVWIFFPQFVENFFCLDKIRKKKFSRQKNINARLSGKQRVLNSYCISIWLTVYKKKKLKTSDHKTEVSIGEHITEIWASGCQGLTKQQAAIRPAYCQMWQKAVVKREAICHSSCPALNKKIFNMFGPKCAALVFMKPGSWVILDWTWRGAAGQSLTTRYDSSLALGLYLLHSSSSVSALSQTSCHPDRETGFPVM